MFEHLITQHDVEALVRKTESDHRGANESRNPQRPRTADTQGVVVGSWTIVVRQRRSVISLERNDKLIPSPQPASRIREGPYPRAEDSTLQSPARNRAIDSQRQPRRGRSELDAELIFYVPWVRCGDLVLGSRGALATVGLISLVAHRSLVPARD